VPELGLGVFISTNTPTGGALSGGLPGAIVEHFYATPPPPPQGSAELRRAHRVFEGDYQSTRRPYSGLEGFVFRLIGSVSIAVTPDGTLMTASTLGGVQRWALDGPLDQARFRAPGETGPLTFEVRNGQAARAYLPGGIMALERIGFWNRSIVLILLTVLVFIASAATIQGVVGRLRRDERQTTVQARASLMQTTEAVLWIASIAGFIVWASGANDFAAVVYNWPGLTLVLASASALVATLLSIATLPLLAFVWRGGRRVESWSAARKLRFTFTALLYVAFGAVLFTWGALQPWSG
jgi:hypothetical protein